MESIGTKIAALRRQRGLTQEQLGSQVGVSAQAVSKWENGGAPDVELLPALADRLGVSIDTLFGREERETQDMGTQLSHWLQGIPEGRRLRELVRLLFADLYDLGVPPELQGILRMHPLCEKSSFPPDSSPSQDGEGCWLRSKFVSQEGMLLGVPAEDFPLLLLMPEPEAGYAAAFGPLEDCRKLFLTLSRPGALEVMGWLLKKKRGAYATAPAVARGIGMEIESAEALLTALKDCHLLNSTDLETEDGAVLAYQSNDQEGLVPFLYFTRWLLEKNEAWACSWDVRATPILKEEQEHETQ